MQRLPYEIRSDCANNSSSRPSQISLPDWWDKLSLAAVRPVFNLAPELVKFCQHPQLTQAGINEIIDNS